MIIRLIPRDAPLEPGRKLLFTFTVEAEVPLDEQVLDYEIPEDYVGEAVLAPTTFHDVEQRLDAGKYFSSDQIWRAIRDGYDLRVIEHMVTLADVRDETGDTPARFEAPWEAEERRLGQQDNWRTRVWLDEVPAPSTGASVPPGISRTTRIDL